MTLQTEVRCRNSKAERVIKLADFIKDAYTTALAHDEVVSEVAVRIPAQGSGGAYLAFKRSAPVYPTASAAVQLTMDGDVCNDAAIALGCVGLTAIKAKEAAAAIRGKRLTEKAITAALDAAHAAAEPQSDMRGSADYKRTLVGSLVKRAIQAALRRARGEEIELSHIYA
jgi:aerobic carbon-monoxide dehydrogenase medium subunit